MSWINSLVCGYGAGVAAGMVAIHYGSGIDSVGLVILVATASTVGTILTFPLNR